MDLWHALASFRRKGTVIQNQTVLFYKPNFKSVAVKLKWASQEMAKLQNYKPPNRAKSKCVSLHRVEPSSKLKLCTLNFDQNYYFYKYIRDCLDWEFCTYRQFPRHCNKKQDASALPTHQCHICHFEEKNCSSINRQNIIFVLSVWFFFVFNNTF